VGKKLEEVKELYAGDVGIASKSATFKTNDTITEGEGASASCLCGFPIRFIRWR
jgi:hypothetical protein